MSPALPVARAAQGQCYVFTMKIFVAYLIGIFVSFSIYANEINVNVVEENVVSKWGYFTKQLPGSYDYKELNKPGPVTSLKYQLIRSKLPIRGETNSYFYFTLSEECFSNKYRAIRRRVALSFRDEKDYRLAFVSGNCVFITGCAAKSETFEEQPKIHKVFEEYVLAKKSHNTSLKPAGTARSCSWPARLSSVLGIKRSQWNQQYFLN